MYQKYAGSHENLMKYFSLFYHLHLCFLVLHFLFLVLRLLKFSRFHLFERQFHIMKFFVWNSVNFLRNAWLKLYEKRCQMLRPKNGSFYFLSNNLHRVFGSATILSFRMNSSQLDLPWLNRLHYKNYLKILYDTTYITETHKFLQILSKLFKHSFSNYFFTLHLTC